MTKPPFSSARQMGLGFDAMLDEQETAHLPCSMEAAIPEYRRLLQHHHQAMLAADVKQAMAIRKEANRLAVKVNGGDLGILADSDSAGNVLERETAAPPDTVPMWGQQGDFVIQVGSTPVHIAMEGILGASAGMSVWPGFSANAVEPDKPFFSETGFRSFLNVHADMAPGMTPDSFVRKVIESHIRGECKGRLRPASQEYRGRY
jgi:hypothetical protein